LEINIVLEELRRQNKSVYNDVFNRFYKGMVAYANNFLFDQQASEDVVQEIFISLWENSREIDIRSSLKSYLHTVVRNRCLNYLKTLKITDNLNLIDLNSMLILEEELYVLSDEEKKILYNRIFKLVETFPESMQQIFKLKFISNYSYLEIADELNVSVNTVKTQLKRAKERINNSMLLLMVLLNTLL
jgi:RNA polymerase sigma-70 factor (ECF subfamily)